MLDILKQVDLWKHLGEFALIFFILVAAIYWLVRRLDKREAELQTLHEYIRKNDASNLEVLTELSNTLDKVIISLNTSNDEIRNQLKTESDMLKQVIALKNEELKTFIKHGTNG